MLEQHFADLKLYTMFPIAERYNTIHANASLQDKLLCVFFTWPYIQNMYCRFGSDDTFRHHLIDPWDNILENLGYFIPNVILGVINLVLGLFGESLSSYVMYVLYG